MKHLERQRARELRSRGYSIKDIARELSVSKSSVSLWVRDVRLTESQLERLNQRQADVRVRFSYLNSGRASTTKAEKRHQESEVAGYERARANETFRLVCALYWGEGTKRKGDGFAVANSDPKLLRLLLSWLIQAGYDDVLVFRVHYYAENGLSEDDIKQWWNEQLPGLKQKHWRRFVQCKLNRASQRKKVGSLPYGTATISVYRTELFYEIMGGIKYLQAMGDW